MASNALTKMLMWPRHTLVMNISLDVNLSCLIYLK